MDYWTICVGISIQESSRAEFSEVCNMSHTCSMELNLAFAGVNSVLENHLSVLYFCFAARKLEKSGNVRYIFQTF